MPQAAAGTRKAANTGKVAPPSQIQQMVPAVKHASPQDQANAYDATSVNSTNDPPSTPAFRTTLTPHDWAKTTSQWRTLRASKAAELEDLETIFAAQKLIGDNVNGVVSSIVSDKDTDAPGENAASGRPHFHELPEYVQKHMESVGRGSARIGGPARRLIDEKEREIKRTDEIIAGLENEDREIQGMTFAQFYTALRIVEGMPPEGRMKDLLESLKGYALKHPDGYNTEGVSEEEQERIEVGGAQMSNAALVAKAMEDGPPLPLWVAQVPMPKPAVTEPKPDEDVRVEDVITDDDKQAADTKYNGTTQRSPAAQTNEVVASEEKASRTAQPSATLVKVTITALQNAIQVTSSMPTMRSDHEIEHQDQASETKGSAKRPLSLPNSTDKTLSRKIDVSQRKSAKDGKAQAKEGLRFGTAMLRKPTIKTKVCLLPWEKSKSTLSGVGESRPTPPAPRRREGHAKENRTAAPPKASREPTGTVAPPPRGRAIRVNDRDGSVRRRSHSPGSAHSKRDGDVSQVPIRDRDPLRRRGGDDSRHELDTRRPTDAHQPTISSRAKSKNVRANGSAPANHPPRTEDARRGLPVAQAASKQVAKAIATYKEDEDNFVDNRTREEIDEETCRHYAATRRRTHERAEPFKQEQRKRKLGLVAGIDEMDSNDEITIKKPKKKAQKLDERSTDKKKAGATCRISHQEQAKTIRTDRNVVDAEPHASRAINPRRFPVHPKIHENANKPAKRSRAPAQRVEEAPVVKIVAKEHTDSDKKNRPNKVQKKPEADGQVQKRTAKPTLGDRIPQNVRAGRGVAKVVKKAPKPRNDFDEDNFIVGDDESTSSEDSSDEDDDKKMRNKVAARKSAPKVKTTSAKPKRQTINTSKKSVEIIADSDDSFRDDNKGAVNSNSSDDKTRPIQGSRKRCREYDDIATSPRSIKRRRGDDDADAPPRSPKLREKEVAAIIEMA